MLDSIISLHELESSNPLNFWDTLKKSTPNLCCAALEILAIPAQSAGSERIFSAMNTVVTKTRCSLKQCNVGPLVESALRFKQNRLSDLSILRVLEMNVNCISNLENLEF